MPIPSKILYYCDLNIICITHIGHIVIKYMQSCIYIYFIQTTHHEWFSQTPNSKQLGSETEAKFSRLQDVVPNIRRTVPICFHFFRNNFGTKNIEASLFQRSAFNLVRLILVKSVWKLADIQIFCIYIFWGYLCLIIKIVF